MTAALGTTVRLPAPELKHLERSWTEAEAFAHCARITHGHYENFPVGSIVIPASLRPAVHSLYAFMRTSDDFSDENRRPGDEEERLAWLASWDRMLDACVAGEARHPVFVALRSTLTQHDLPVAWLKDLLSAFSQDVTKRRYADWNELEDYCRRSANPVGRLILALFGYRDEIRFRQSDAICTALQLANHWQDVAVDLQKDRIYLPREEMARFGVTENHLMQLASPGLRPPSPDGRGVGGEAECFRALMDYQLERARGLFRVGEPLPGSVSGRLRYELRATWLGGMRVLEKIEAAGYDVFRRRPVVSKVDWALIGAQALLGL